MDNRINLSTRYGNWNQEPERTTRMYVAKLLYWYQGYSVTAELTPDEDNLRPTEEEYGENSVASFQQGEWEYVNLTVTVKDDDGRTGRAYGYGYEYGYGPVDGRRFVNPLHNPDDYPLIVKVDDAIAALREGA